MDKKIGKALVVGAGISGIRSALDLAETGYQLVHPRRLRLLEIVRIEQPVAVVVRPHGDDPACGARLITAGPDTVAATGAAVAADGPDTISPATSRGGLPSFLPSGMAKLAW